MIKLDQPIQNNAYIRPAILPSNCGERIAEERVIAIGKGGKQLDKVLRYANLDLLPQNTCEKFLKLDKDANHKQNSIYCAYTISGQTIFTGDSGKFTVFY